MHGALMAGRRELKPAIFLVDADQEFGLDDVGEERSSDLLAAIQAAMVRFTVAPSIGWAQNSAVATTAATSK